MPQPAEREIHDALAAVSRAIGILETAEHEAYANAAFECRIAAYGNHCAQRVLLQQARSILSLLARSVSAPGLLATEKP